MGVGDGSVGALFDVEVTGNASTQWNLLLMGDGYRAADLPKFRADCAAFAKSFLAFEPFFSLAREINVFGLEVQSTDAGADDPRTGATPKTFFDSGFAGANGLSRYLTLDYASALTVAKSVAGQVPSDGRLVLVNVADDGGSAKGHVGVMAVGAQGSANYQIGIHELGHAAFGLEDEYSYEVQCGIGAGKPYPVGAAPRNTNITEARAAAGVPWELLLNPPNPRLPTTTNPVPNCADCDMNPYANLRATVGTFEGAGTYACGAFRPQVDCLMRTRGMPFCVVCRAKITASITGVPWP
jgi:hypothetical protein